MKPMLNSFRNRWATFGLAGVVAASGAAYALAQNSQTGTHADVNVPLQETSVARDGLPRGSYAPIVDRVSPAVVKIETTETIQRPQGQDFPGFNDQLFRQFLARHSRSTKAHRKLHTASDRGIVTKEAAS